MTNNQQVITDFLVKYFQLIVKFQHILTYFLILTLRLKLRHYQDGILFNFYASLSKREENQIHQQGIIILSGWPLLFFLLH